MEYDHVSVLPDEAMEGLCIKGDGFYIDATLGGAGHARKICEKLSAAGRFLGIDQDEEAVIVAKERLSSVKPLVQIVHANFSSLRTLVNNEESVADGILFDLGVSSHQIDESARGFSYINDGPLDMRMDRSRTLTAADVVNTYSPGELLRIFRDYGEERWSKRIVQFIVENRPLTSTGQLVDVVERSIPKAFRRQMKGHPAKRIFQAIRIEVNKELSILPGAIRDAVDILKPGGRIVVITFHSLEDRIVKDTFKDLSRNCICPPHQPICTCRHKAKLKLLGKAKKPTEAEINANPRAKSAKIRVAEKI